MHNTRRLVCIVVALFALVGAAAAAAPRHTTIRNVGIFPGDMAVGYGSVWETDHRGGALYRITRSNRVTKVSIGESVCNFPAIGGGYVWVWGCDSNRTYQVDPARMKIVGHRQGVLPVYGASSLWTMNQNGEILRIDPKSGVVLARIGPQTDDTPNGGADGVWDGSLWVSGDSSISRIDVTTNKVTAVVPLPGALPSGDKPGGYLYANFGVFAFGKFWASNAAGMYVIDPATNVAHKIAVPLHPRSQGGDVPVVAGAGSVWVRTGDTTVVRIDPTTEQAIETYPAAGGGGGIAVAFGSLWVANGGLSTVWRTPVH
jgi:hypothetical protein